LKSFRDALSFLTIIKFYSQDFNAAESVRSFAYAGLFIGFLIGGVNLLLGDFYLREAVILLVWVAVTGALHLDGLMDTADALFSHRERERKLEIMKDSRSGAMAIVAAVILLLFKYEALKAVESSLVLILIPAFARFGLVWSMRTMPYIRSEGTGKPFFESVNQSWMYQAIPLLALSLFCGVKFTLVATAVFIVTVYLLQLWYRKQLGGVTGDLLGAQCEITETAMLIFAGALL